uniref:Uncharacterized protein n=1 Tax=Glossina palpalis gambiensis TaxID=67801 RepID=A0A1B0C6W6_9MUSC
MADRTSISPIYYMIVSYISRAQFLRPQELPNARTLLNSLIHKLSTNQSSGHISALFCINNNRRSKLNGNNN